MKALSPMDGLGRKFYHSLGGVWLISMYYLLGRDRALLFYGSLFLFVLAVETVRLSVPAVNELFFRRFGSFIRKKEEKKPTGTLWYILGVGLSFYLYAPETAAAAICFLAFGDVTAATVGQRYGKTKIGDKSVEGTAGFLLACAAAAVVLIAAGLALPWPALLIGAVVAAAVELLPLPLNDNFAIPVISGGAMEALLRVIG